MWNYPSRLVHGSFRFEQYVAGFRALGHDPVAVCAEGAEEGFEGPVLTAPASEPLVAEPFEDPAFWSEVGADVAVVVTWHRMPGVLRAIREAGTKVAAFADSEGRIGTRRHWGYHFERHWHYLDGPAAKARFAVRWLRDRLGERWRGRYPEDELAVQSTRASDVVAIGHEEGRRLFVEVLEANLAPELAERVVVVPFTVGESVFRLDVPEEKEDHIVGVGRWDDPQKHAPRLAKALDRFFVRRSSTKVELFGRGASEEEAEGDAPFAPFAAVAARHPGRLRLRGVRPQEEVAESMRTARTIVFSSRWEGCPHAALEALCLGCTVVGTPIPSLKSWSEDGRYGRVAGGWSAGALAGALEREMASWSAGRRAPREISRHWRERIRPEAVCGRLLEEVSERG